jgi:hypothetical protein
MMKHTLLACTVALALMSETAVAAVTPAILTSDNNRVSACVKPERLMQFVKARNEKLDRRFDDIATFYKQHGNAVGVRWDYAFFQMLVETNYLSYKAPNGKWGDVKPDQNNFAGLGAIGKGAPGESFDDVSTGVLAHLHHIRLYSGNPVENPAAERTKLVEGIILPWAQEFGRPVTFTDLTKRWSPTDKGYSDDIETVAKTYRSKFCTGNEPGETVTEAPAAGEASADTTASVETAAFKADESGACKVFTASYGGAKALLIASQAEGLTRYTALSVHEGKENAQAQAFINVYAPGGEAVGSFASEDEALAKAFELCPES